MGLAIARLPATATVGPRLRLHHLRLEGLMTHFACADDVGDTVSPGQIEAFRACLAALSARGIYPALRHVCNSAGMVRLPHAHFEVQTRTWSRLRKRRSGAASRSRCV